MIDDDHKVVFVLAFEDVRRCFQVKEECFVHLGTFENLP